MKPIESEGKHTNDLKSDEMNNNEIECIKKTPCSAEQSILNTCESSQECFASEISNITEIKTTNGDSVIEENIDSCDLKKNVPKSGVSEMLASSEIKTSNEDSVIDLKKNVSSPEPVTISDAGKKEVKEDGEDVSIGCSNQTSVDSDVNARTELVTVPGDSTKNDFKDIVLSSFECLTSNEKVTVINDSDNKIGSNENVSFCTSIETSVKIVPSKEEKKGIHKDSAQYGANEVVLSSFECLRSDKIITVINDSDDSEDVIYCSSTPASSDTVLKIKTKKETPKDPSFEGITSCQLVTVINDSDDSENVLINPTIKASRETISTTEPKEKSVLKKSSFECLTLVHFSDDSEDGIDYTSEQANLVMVANTKPKEVCERIAQNDLKEISLSSFKCLPSPLTEMIKIDLDDKDKFKDDNAFSAIETPLSNQNMNISNSSISNQESQNSNKRDDPENNSDLLGIENVSMENKSGSDVMKILSDSLIIDKEKKAIALSEETSGSSRSDLKEENSNPSMSDQSHLESMTANVPVVISNVHSKPSVTLNDSSSENCSTHELINQPVEVSRDTEISQNNHDTSERLEPSQENVDCENVLNSSLEQLVEDNQFSDLGSENLKSGNDTFSSIEKNLHKVEDIELNNIKTDHAISASPVIEIVPEQVASSEVTEICTVDPYQNPVEKIEDANNNNKSPKSGDFVYTSVNQDEVTILEVKESKENNAIPACLDIIRSTDFLLPVVEESKSPPPNDSTKQINDPVEVLKPVKNSVTCAENSVKTPRVNKSNVPSKATTITVIDISDDESLPEDNTRSCTLALECEDDMVEPPSDDEVQIYTPVETPTSLKKTASVASHKKKNFVYSNTSTSNTNIIEATEFLLPVLAHDEILSSLKSEETNQSIITDNIDNAFIIPESLSENPFYNSYVNESQTETSESSSSLKYKSRSSIFGKRSSTDEYELPTKVCIRSNLSGSAVSTVGNVCNDSAIFSKEIKIVLNRFDDDWKKNNDAVIGLQSFKVEIENVADSHDVSLQGNPFCNNKSPNRVSTDLESYSSILSDNLPVFGEKFISDLCFSTIATEKPVEDSMDMEKKKFQENWPKYQDQSSLESKSFSGTVNIAKQQDLTLNMQKPVDVQRCSPEKLSKSPIASNVMIDLSKGVTKNKRGRKRKHSSLASDPNVSPVKTSPRLPQISTRARSPQKSAFSLKHKDFKYVNVGKQNLKQSNSEKFQGGSRSSTLGSTVPKLKEKEVKVRKRGRPCKPTNSLHFKNEKLPVPSSGSSLLKLKITRRTLKKSNISKAVDTSSSHNPTKIKITSPAKPTPIVISKGVKKRILSKEGLNANEKLKPSEDLAQNNTIKNISNPSISKQAEKITANRRKNPKPFISLKFPSKNKGVPLKSTVLSSGNEESSTGMDVEEFPSNKVQSLQKPSVSHKLASKNKMKHLRSDIPSSSDDNSINEVRILSKETLSPNKRLNTCKPSEIRAQNYAIKNIPNPSFSKPPEKITTSRRGKPKTSTFLGFTSKNKGVPLKSAVLSNSDEENLSGTDCEVQSLQKPSVSLKLSSKNKVKHVKSDISSSNDDESSDEVNSGMDIDDLFALSVEKMCDKKRKMSPKKTDNKSFECFMCSKTFSENSKLKKHFRKHIKKVVARTKKRYTCIFCKKQSISRHELKKHMKKKHSVSNDKISIKTKGMPLQSSETSSSESNDTDSDNKLERTAYQKSLHKSGAKAETAVSSHSGNKGKPQLPNKDFVKSSSCIDNQNTLKTSLPTKGRSKLQGNPSHKPIKQSNLATEEIKSPRTTRNRNPKFKKESPPKRSAAKFECPICLRKYQSLRGMEIHILTVHPE